VLGDGLGVGDGGLLPESDGDGVGVTVGADRRRGDGEVVGDGDRDGLVRLGDGDGDEDGFSCPVAGAVVFDCVPLAGSPAGAGRTE
jgi:hypothetical protein